MVGAVLFMGGISVYLYNWIETQKIRQKRLEEFICFLQKFVFAVDTEKVKIISFFSGYDCEDKLLVETLHEIASKLRSNTYPEGQMVWEEVFKEKEQNWTFDKETFGMILKAGNGFFGRNKNENICFLQKSIRELEMQKERQKEKDAKERKVWIPVGLLGGIMLVIIFI